MRWGVYVAGGFALGTSLSCLTGLSATPTGPRPEPAPSQRAIATAAAHEHIKPSAPEATATASAAAPEPGPRPGDRVDLGLEQDRVALPAGRWAVEVHFPARRLVTIGVHGPREALRSFHVIGDRKLLRLRTGSLDDDRRLPAFIAFESPDGSEPLVVVVDASEPIELLRVLAQPFDAEKHAGAEVPLVALPFPIERNAGYLLQTAPRYAFVRADVAAALRSAFRDTRLRLRRNSIAVGDASQWNGIRPATDIGRTRHISHQGGRDVDIGLPSRDGHSRILTRCQTVRLEKDWVECEPGTAKGFDAERMAYFLAKLVEGTTPGGRYIASRKHRPGPIAEVELILLDQVFIDEVRNVLPELRSRRWIHDDAVVALDEGGILRHSPWHVDHVHVRFRGQPAVVPPGLRFESLSGEEPSEAEAESAAEGSPQTAGESHSAPKAATTAP